jgi:hypothetical protein
VDYEGQGFQTSTKMPHFIQKNVVWCAFSVVGIVGLVFLEVNVNYKSSRALLEEEFVPTYKEFVVI